MMAAATRTPVRAAALPAVAAPPRPVRLWLPLTPLFWLLSPFALLLAPFLWVWLPRSKRPTRPYAAAIGLGRVLVSLGGLAIDVRTPGARLFIRIF
jgi:hypothetical protein